MAVLDAFGGPLGISVAVLAMFAGALVQGAVGFGAALIAAPVVALVDARAIPGPMLAASLALSVLLARRDQASLAPRRVAWALGGRVPGIAVGLIALAVLSERGLRFGFAALVLVAVAMSATSGHVVVTPKTLFGAGLVSGFMGTVGSIGGPPMALLYQSEPGKNLRADLSAYFTVGGALSLAGVAAIGRFGMHELGWTLLLLPAVLVGYWFSHHGAAVLDRGRTRRAVLAVSTIAAGAVILRELLER